MVGIAADYLNSLGRTIQFLCDTYAGKMSSEVSGNTLYNLCSLFYMLPFRKLFYMHCLRVALHVWANLSDTSMTTYCAVAQEWLSWRRSL